LAAGISVLILTLTVALAQTADRQIFRLGTASTDSVSHTLGVTLAALIKLKLLPNGNIDVDARNTLGSDDNIRQLRDGALDFAIINSFDSFHAVRGTGPFAADGAAPGLRTLTNLWTSAFYFIVKSRDASTGTFADFLSLQGRRIAVGREGSTQRDQATALLAAIDIDIDDAYQLQNLDAENAKQAFLNGQIDGFLLIDDRQGAEVNAFFEQAGDQATLLALGDQQIGVIGSDGDQPWTLINAPEALFPDQGDAFQTIGIKNLLATHEQLADDAVYQITKTVFDNLPFLQEMHGAANEIDLETALERLALPVHAGAADYYNEVGVTLPEPARVSTLSQTPFLNRYSTAQEARARLSGNTFIVLGGQEGQTSTRMINELAGSLGDTELRVVGMTTPRPAENIADVLYARGVDSAIVPLNVLNYARAQNVYPDVDRKIAYAAELFTEEVHLIVRDGIGELEDLVDRPVNLGLPGSIAEFTASFLLDQQNIPVTATYDNHQIALARLLKGEIDGAFVVSGKPAPILLEVQANAGLHLLPLPVLDDASYRPATLSAADYPNLIAPKDEIETFGVRNMLLSYNWRDDNPRFDVLASFVDIFFDQLPALQTEGAGYHTKWQEINPFRDIDGWTRSPAALNWLQRQPLSDDRTTNPGG